MYYLLKDKATISLFLSDAIKDVGPTSLNEQWTNIKDTAQNAFKKETWNDIKKSAQNAFKKGKWDAAKQAIRNVANKAVENPLDTIAKII